MILYVKNISGVFLKIELQPGSSVLDLKKKIHDASAEKYRVDAIGLDFGAQSFEDNCMIADYNLQNESTLTLVSILLKLFSDSCDYFVPIACRGLQKEKTLIKKW